MLIEDGKITDGLFEVQEELPTKSMNPLDKAAMIKAMAAAKGKDWARQPTDSGEVYSGPGAYNVDPSKGSWEPITSNDIGYLHNLGIKF